MDERRFDILAAAYVRGCALETGAPELPARLADAPLEELDGAELAALLRAGAASGLKLHAFKGTKTLLPRVKKVLGFLRGLDFDGLVDVGSGRGAFLVPFLAQFPDARAAAVDLLPHRAEFWRRLAAGGVPGLCSLCGDFAALEFEPRSADVVTLLEVLEHMPEPEPAVRQAMRVARRFVVVSVPSQPDDNPEHIQLLTKARLTALFAAAGCARLNFDGVNGHLIPVASAPEEG